MNPITDKSNPTSPTTSGELREHLASLVLKFRQSGYWDEALLELEPHNREFVDSTSWAGELHWEQMQKLHVQEIMEAIEAHTTQQIKKFKQAVEEAVQGHYDFSGRQHDNHDECVPLSALNTVFNQFTGGEK